MRRIGRILLNALTALSLVLCLATAGLWMRSYWRWDFVHWSQSFRPGVETLSVSLYSSGAGIAVYLGVQRPENAGEADDSGWRWGSYGPSIIPYGAAVPANRWGFGHDSLRHPIGHWGRIVFPIWLPATIFALLPLARGALAIRYCRRIRQGNCRFCGYDLRATPDRCPECGTPAAQKRATRPALTSRKAGGDPAAGNSG